MQGDLSGSDAGLTSVREAKEERGLGWKSHVAQAFDYLSDAGHLRAREQRSPVRGRNGSGRNGPGLVPQSAQCNN